MQYAPDDDSSLLLSAKKINLLQQIVGTLLYYSIAVELTMIVALGSISVQQAKGTEENYTDTLWLLNSTATHPKATIRYTASDMALHIHIYASYPPNLEPAAVLVETISWVTFDLTYPSHPQLVLVSIVPSTQFPASCPT